MFRAVSVIGAENNKQKTAADAVLDIQRALNTLVQF